MKIFLFLTMIASLAFGWSYTFNPSFFDDALEGDRELQTAAVQDGCHDGSETSGEGSSAEDKNCVLEADSPTLITEIRGGKALTASRAWRPPNYEGQSRALGYNKETFATPEGLEVPVAFWTDIYTKYTTNQGVLHDTEYLNVIYDKVDFSDIMANASLTQRQKHKAREKRVKEMEKEIQGLLQKLDERSASAEGKPEDLSDLSEKEQKVWHLFEKVDAKDKFKLAADKDRIRFQLGQKNKIESAIFYSGRYLEDMETLYKEMGLPPELTRIAFVESSFNVLARSKVGASGLWQIMPYVARRKITPALDWRNHPMEATRISAKMLRANYEMLESWPLAITGYNHGPTGVSKLTKKYRTRQISDLIANVRGSRTFGFASRNFYPCFLAMLQIERDATKYFPQATWSEKLKETEVLLPKPVTYKEVLAWFDGNEEMAQVYNPHITALARSGKTKIPAKAKLWVREEMLNAVMAKLEGKAAAPLVASDNKPSEESTFQKVSQNREPAAKKAEALPEDKYGGFFPTTEFGLEGFAVELESLTEESGSFLRTEPLKNLADDSLPN